MWPSRPGPAAGGSPPRTMALDMSGGAAVLAVGSAPIALSGLVVLAAVTAVVLALFLLGSLMVYGPRLWHLPVVVGVGLLLVRRRI